MNQTDTHHPVSQEGEQREEKRSVPFHEPCLTCGGKDYSLTGQCGKCFNTSHGIKNHHPSNQLSSFLEWVDKRTTLFEDKDVTINQVVSEYLSSTPPEEKHVRELDSVAEEEKIELAKICNEISDDDWNNGDWSEGGREFLVKHTLIKIKDNKSVPFNTAIMLYRYLSSKGYKL